MASGSEKQHALHLEHEDGVAAKIRSGMGADVEAAHSVNEVDKSQRHAYADTGSQIDSHRDEEGHHENDGFARFPF